MMRFAFLRAHQQRICRHMVPTYTGLIRNQESGTAADDDCGFIINDLMHFCGREAVKF